MAFTMNVSGMDELMRKMDQLGEKAQDAASAALYEGAGVAADAVSQAVAGIATEPFRYVGNGKRRKPSPEEKAVLMNARIGVAKFRKTPMNVNTSVGMQSSGYGELAGKIVPIPLIANAINSGTSFMERQPFFRKATSKSKAAEAAIENKRREERDKRGDV